MVNGSPSTTRDGDTVKITEDGSRPIVGRPPSCPVGSHSSRSSDRQRRRLQPHGVRERRSVDRPVAITITPAAVCPDSGVSGQQEFATDDDFGAEGQGTLNIGGLTSNACIGLGINFSQEDSNNAQQWTIDERKPAATDKITGYATWIWDQPGTDAIPWTTDQVESQRRRHPPGDRLRRPPALQRRRRDRPDAEPAHGEQPCLRGTVPDRGHLAGEHPRRGLHVPLGAHELCQHLYRDPADRDLRGPWRKEGLGVRGASL